MDEQLIYEMKYNQGFYDGYKKATEQANAVITDIKAEILKLQIINPNTGLVSGRAEDMKQIILSIINNHISGKEQTGEKT